jgi:hypothetical protein
MAGEPPSPRGASLSVPRLPPIQARQIPVGQRALARGGQGEHIIHRAILAGNAEAASVWRTKFSSSSKLTQQQLARSVVSRYETDSEVSRGVPGLKGVGSGHTPWRFALVPLVR